ncbi:MAG: peptidylprolyl isomerase [Silanimonas sp.]
MRLPNAITCLTGALAASLATSAAIAQPAATPPRTMDEIVAAAPASAWRTPDPNDVLVMTLDSGRVVIELAPGYAPEHVANLRTLAREGYFDGLTINRSQDNFVVQWGDADGEDPAKAKPLGSAKAALPAEFDTAIRDDLAFARLPDVDGWAPQVGFSGGFPVGRDPQAGRQWLTHCYATVGAGRGNAPDSSNGTELYVVTGQSPRQLDLNITTVGRVLEGMHLLSALPRSLAPGGFYTQPALRTPIRRVALASALPEAERPRLQVMDTGSASFEALVEARRNRADAWYLRKAGHIDLCSVPIPVRTTPAPTAPSGG